MADSFKIEVHNAELKGIQETLKAMPKVRRKLLAKLAAIARNAIVDGSTEGGIKPCPVGKGWRARWTGGKVKIIRKSGQLRSSIKREVTSEQARVGSKLKYAPAILGDTDPFPIRPVRKKTLFFAVSSTEVHYRGKKAHNYIVIHPGGKKLTGGSFSKATILVNDKAPAVVRELMIKEGTELK